MIPPRLSRLAIAAVAVSALAAAARAGEIPAAERRSGYEQMSAETKAMQDDDTANPGMLWVLDGEALWNAKAGEAGRACAEREKILAFGRKRLGALPLDAADVD